MQAVLISINPKWCEPIASGEKTIEVRKTKPKLETPFKVYIYCTKGKFEPHEHLRGNLHYDDSVVLVNEGQGMVIGEFVCDKIYQYSTLQNVEGVDITHEEMTKASCLTKEDIEAYELSTEAKENCRYKIGVYGWHISDLKIYDKPRELSEFSKYGFGHPVPLKRPPQSWMYVEVEG